MTSCISCCKCNTFIHQGRGEHKWSTPPDIWPNWKKSFWPNQTIYSVIRERGNNYILVDYHYDANNILTSPLINRKVPCILNSIMKIHDKLNKWGLTPKLHIVDNEVSEDLKQYFEDSDIHFQLVPPHRHRINATKRAVRTFKNHLISDLYTVYPCFPFYLWRLLPQVTTTLNMLKLSRLNPELSAYEQVDGIHHFEQTPLAPFGCKV